MDGLEVFLRDLQVVSYWAKSEYMGLGHYLGHTRLYLLVFWWVLLGLILPIP